MANVSRPLIALLVGTVAFFAVWLVALKPSSPTGASSGGSIGQLQGPINAAKSVQGTVDASAAKDGGTPGATSIPTTSLPAVTTTPAVATTPAATPAVATTPAPTTATTATRTQALAPAKARLNTVQRALKEHKVVALLFYNPAAADDVAVKREMKAIPARRGAVIKLSVPLSELSHYTAVTDHVQVQYSPTLVLIDRHANATTLVGFADTFEIANRVDDALTSH
jgi:hypothetical protein